MTNAWGSGFTFPERQSKLVILQFGNYFKKTANVKYKKPIGCKHSQSYLGDGAPEYILNCYTGLYFINKIIMLSLDLW